MSQDHLEIVFLVFIKQLYEVPTQGRCQLILIFFYLHINNESFHVVCFQCRCRSSRSQMFFKIGFLKVWQSSQENTCVGVSFYESCMPESLPDCNFIKWRLQHRQFPLNVVRPLRTPFLRGTSSGCFCRCNPLLSFKAHPPKDVSLVFITVIVVRK